MFGSWKQFLPGVRQKPEKERSMFGRKKKQHSEIKPYNPGTQTPVIRASICTGEQVAGFKDKESGKFEEAMLIRGEEDLQEFCSRYQVNREDIKKVW